jgi:radical SAM enzyme (rSAM/lipoprotein system)
MSSPLHLSLKKRIGLELFRRWKATVAKEHPLRYLFWECTLRCNLRCAHCGSDCRSSASTVDMPLADFLKALDSVARHTNPNGVMLALTGGEPLMRNDLEQCGRAFNERGFPWGMVTNGMLLDERRFERLLNAGLGAATVSLDGLAESHNRLRGNPASYQRAWAAAKLIATPSAELAYDIVTCANQWNYHELPTLRDMLVDAGIKAWRIFTIFPIGRAANNPALQLSPEQLRGLFDFIAATRKEGKIQLDYGCEGFLGDYENEVRSGFFFCRAGITVGSVMVDGSISACPDLRANFVQGSIYDDDFMDVWNNRYQPYRDRAWAQQGICADCTSFRYCQGSGMHLRDEQGNLLFCHLKRLEEV